ncbi:transmembrane and ubiquitin-like domain-containing protein 2 [Brachionichthys hirsutus]|uniref:transmembrane and ubiquitin-like domain-containing protein 2 n=1 Tax=Brachionichthys hirsutus TaxID=412623 RepID=UPI0036054574
MAVLDGMEDAVTAAGGVLFLTLALVLAWLSTHVADRGDHILGTILTVGTQASLFRLGDHDSYGAGSPSADAPVRQTPPPSQENKPDDGEPGAETGDGEGAEGVGTDLLDIQSKQRQAGRVHTSDEEDDVVDEEELEDEDKKILNPTPPAGATAATCMSVRLKFLNDTEEVAVVDPRDTVGGLKRKFFSGQEHQIKLIYRGRLLQDPERTLSSLNVTHHSVIHCHVSQPPHQPAPEDGASGGVQAAGAAVSTGSLVVPVFVVVLAVVWYFRINYRQFFTAPATVSLVGVTVFFSFLIFGMHRR